MTNHMYKNFRDGKACLENNIAVGKVKKDELETASRDWLIMSLIGQG